MRRTLFEGHRCCSRLTLAAEVTELVDAREIDELEGVTLGGDSMDVGAEPSNTANGDADAFSAVHSAAQGLLTPSTTDRFALSPADTPAGADGIREPYVHSDDEEENDDEQGDGGDREEMQVEEEDDEEEDDEEEDDEDDGADRTEDAPGEARKERIALLRSLLAAEHQKLADVKAKLRDPLRCSNPSIRVCTGRWRCGTVLTRLADENGTSHG